MSREQYKLQQWEGYRVSHQNEYVAAFDAELQFFGIYSVSVALI